MITPGQVADGSERVHPADWPMLAAQWLAEGFDSDELRGLAALSATEGDRLRPARMRAVLRSIGVSVPDEATLIERCDRALALVQRDLDATGFTRFQFHTVTSDDWSTDVRPLFRAALPEGWDHNAETLDPTADFTELLGEAASAVTETILEIWFVAWPDCPHHNGPPLTARSRTTSEAETAWAWWCCPRGDHTVAPVGQLRAEDVRPLPEHLS